VDVTVRRTSLTGTPESGATARGIHAIGTGCTAGETLTSATLTNSSGQLRLALPYGTWTIGATRGTRTGIITPVVVRPGTIPTVTVVVAVTVHARQRDRQAGITVAEMSIVVALLGLVLALALQRLGAYQRAAAATDTRQRNLDEPGW
jgi:hypothetical protein